jgi:hypothetical protein
MGVVLRKGQVGILIVVREMLQEKTMNNGEVFGLIKFLKNEDFLSQLCSGKLFCNTPEYYRLNTENGVSDHFESCSWSFRKSRGDTGAKIVVDGHSIEGLTNVTIRASGLRDSWLHCWTTLVMPQDEIELDILVRDLRRIRSEFGLNYAYIPPSNIHPFFDYIKTLTSHEVRAGRVTYSEKASDYSPLCKSAKYRYQREFRFLIGECQELSTEPLIIQSQKGFGEFILKNISINISSTDDEWIWLGINGTQDIVHNKLRSEVVGT